MNLKHYIPNESIPAYSGPLPACPVCFEELQAVLVDTILTCCGKRVYIEVRPDGYYCVVFHF